MPRILGLPAHIWTMAVWATVVALSALASGVVGPLLTDAPVRAPSAIGTVVYLAVAATLVALGARTPTWLLHLVLISWLLGGMLDGLMDVDVDTIIFTVANAMLVVLFAGFWWHGRVAYAYGALASASLLILVLPNAVLSINVNTWLLITVLLALEAYCLTHGIRRYEALSSRDALTGLLNTYALEAYIDIHSEAGRAISPRSLVSIDIDGLKGINDTRGHHAGDELLRSVAAAWSGTLRPDDLLFRVGGDEFLLILPQTEPSQFPYLAIRLRRAHAAEWSCGVTEWAPGETFQTAMSRADALMYADKRQRSVSKGGA